MKNLFRSTLIVAGLACAVPVMAKNSSHPGHIDLGTFSAAAGCEFVEVNLQSALIKFAAKIAATREPEAAEMLRNIESVRVNVVGLDDSNRAATLSRITALRADLEQRGWEKIVTVQESGSNGDDVAIYMKSRGEDAIAGLVVTVIEKNGKAVLVNIVGDIRADQIAALADKLNVEPLRKIKVSAKVGA
jgi:hypothetical protein